MARRINYAKTDEVATSREERLVRLKFELREHIRFLSNFELLSTEWLRMAESLHQIANVAFMEIHSSAPSRHESNPLLQEGKKASGTLWDQEKDELAIRILLEEGKLNLALRILHQYRVGVRDPRFTLKVAECCAKFNADASVVGGRCRVFEQSLGLLLKYALEHIEAQQIIDMPEFMQHCREVLEDGIKSESKKLRSEKTQETLILYYLASIASKMEEYDEDAVMELAAKEEIFKYLVIHLRKHYSWYTEKTLMQAIIFLNGVCASEAYSCDDSVYVNGEDEQKAIVALKGLFISDVVANNNMKRNTQGKLMDCIARWERQVGATTHFPLQVRQSANESKETSLPPPKPLDFNGK